MRTARGRHQGVTPDTEEGGWEERCEGRRAEIWDKEESGGRVWGCIWYCAASVGCRSAFLFFLYGACACESVGAGDRQCILCFASLLRSCLVVFRAFLPCWSSRRVDDVRVYPFRQTRPRLRQSQACPLSVCHQFLTLAPVLSKSGLCGKSTVFTYEIGFLEMLRNRLRRSSLFFL